MAEWLSEGKAVDAAVYAAIAELRDPDAGRGDAPTDQRRRSQHGLVWDGGDPGGLRWKRRSTRREARPRLARHRLRLRQPRRQAADRAPPSEARRAGGLARRHVPMPRSSSFPSGHTASAFAFATGAGQVLPSLSAPLRSAGHSGRVFPGPHWSPLSRRRARGGLHRRQRRGAGRPPARRRRRSLAHKTPRL